MFHFIRELNMMYDNEDKGIRPVGKKLSLDQFEVQKFNSTNYNKTQELKETIAKERRKSDSYSHKNLLMQQRSIYPTASSNNKQIYHEMPEMVSFINVESKHHFKDINVVVPPPSSELDECALEKYTLSSSDDDGDDDSESTDSTKETLQRLSYLVNEFKLDYDSESTDSTKETLERLSCIANDLNSNSVNNKEEFYVDVESCEYWIENPVEKIIHTVYPIKQIPDTLKAEDIQYKQGTNGFRKSEEALSEEKDSELSQIILRSMSQIQGNIPNSGSVSVSVPMKRNGSQGSIISSASGGSFAFPLLGGELTDTPQVMPGSSTRQRRMVVANKKHMQWYPRWRALACCRPNII